MHLLAFSAIFMPFSEILPVIIEKHECEISAAFAAYNSVLMTDSASCLVIGPRLVKAILPSRSIMTV